MIDPIHTCADCLMQDSQYQTPVVVQVPYIAQQAPTTVVAVISRHVVANHMIWGPNHQARDLLCCHH